MLLGGAIRRFYQSAKWFLFQSTLDEIDGLNIGIGSRNFVLSVIIARIGKAMGGRVAVCLQLLPGFLHIHVEFTDLFRAGPFVLIAEKAHHITLQQLQFLNLALKRTVKNDAARHLASSDDGCL